MLIFKIICISIGSLAVITSIIAFIKDFNDNIKLYRLNVYLLEEKNSWTPFVPFPPNNTIECMMSIIDDATTHGYEFKVENGTVYFREGGLYENISFHN